MRVLFSTKSTSHKNEVVNGHNCHYYADETLHIMRIGNHQQRWPRNVWGGILGIHPLAPYFFHGKLNGNNYLRFLRDDLANR